MLVAAATAGAPARTVSLKIAIYGPGIVKVSDRPSIRCARICHRSLQVRAGSHVTLVARPRRLVKLGPWQGACRGSASVCSLRITRRERVAARFIPPGARTNPIPMQTKWPIGDGWTLKVVAATPKADGQVIDNASGLPAIPSPGAQFFMLVIALGYRATGSAMLDPMIHNWIFEGNHDFKYGYLDDRHCGTGMNVSLPAPDLQPMILNNESVSSGQRVEGHICLQISLNDASTLLLNPSPHGHSGLLDRWFALRS